MGEKLKHIAGLRDANGGVYLAQVDVVRLIAEVREEARAEGFAAAKEMAADVCAKEAEQQKAHRTSLDLSTPTGRAAHAYSEERERMADFLADDIRAMQDEREKCPSCCHERHVGKVCGDGMSCLCVGSP